MNPSLLCKTLAVALAATAAGAASAQTFNFGIPANWTCVGTCGASPADGVVTLAPGGGSQYGWVSTANGSEDVALPGVGGQGQGTNGSVLRSNAFTTDAGAALSFDFNYVTSDGAGYSDYAWARLVNADNSQAALLFTARTVVDGNVVPGFGMPAPEATLSLGSVNIVAGAPQWSPLQTSSGSCFDVGCGYTGWINSHYAIATAGTYRLEFGVTNWDDRAFESGLAFDGVTVGGVPLPVPEPGTYAMLLAGLGLLGFAARRKQA